MQRSTFLPLHHAATLIPSVDWGLGAFPAWYADDHRNVIAVGSTANGKGTFEGGYGASIKVSAPGGIVGYSPFLEGRFAQVDGSRLWFGTSFATPQVSGLAALIWSVDFDHNGEFTLSPAEVREIITETATTPPPGETRTGAGVINAAAALRRAAEKLDIPNRPFITPTTPPEVRSPFVSAGGHYNCGVLEGGSLRCWGGDSHGQATPPEGRFLSVSAGAGHSCGVLKAARSAAGVMTSTGRRRRRRAGSCP